jgi:hypothetical protein
VFGIVVDLIKLNKILVRAYQIVWHSFSFSSHVFDYIREDLEGCENKEFENNSIKKCFFDKKLQIRYQCFAFVEMKEAKLIKDRF